MLAFFVKESLGIQLEVRKDVLGEENMDSFRRGYPSGSVGGSTADTRTAKHKI